ncbi:unnamed protein product [Spirodela intermedia]|uniref:Uncharacterized protein n=1 Tax=Spirodela intermedia TaxID=51605 RepID=A0A7I8KRW4_SPIIN|nr:unnamed protein product [Spirodela intermedia]
MGQGMTMPPERQNPNSSCALFSSSPKRGWLKKTTGTITRYRGSTPSRPTYTAKCPLGGGFGTLRWRRISSFSSPSAWFPRRRCRRWHSR